LDFDRISIDQWHGFAATHPRATVFHHRAWLELLIEQYGFRPHVFALKRNGEIVSAVPFLETRSLSGRRKLISLPFTDWMEVLANDEEASTAMLGGLREMSFPRCQTVVLRMDRPLAGAAVANGWVRHELNTTATLEEIFARFTSATRRNLRKADKNQLTFERRVDAESMETFYRLHVLTRKKLGVPVQARTFFQRLTERVIGHDLGFVGLVRKGSDAIAAAVFLTYGQTMTYKYGASRPDTVDLRPNDYLISNAIRLATEEGCPRFDFGISRLADDGLRRFKRKWGAGESPVHFEYILGNSPHGISQSLPLSMASLAIRHGPHFCCRAIGALFYKYSP
jgi:lipid II:glycine glycyltransferase (peptidoglycan interpeptide bridge formation enzyme)